MNIKAMAPPLDPALAKEMLEFLSEMRTEQRCDFAHATIGLIQFLDKKYPDASKERFRMLTSFSLRYVALNRLRKRPEYQTWSLKIGNGGDDPDVIHEAIVDGCSSSALKAEQAAGVQSGDILSSGVRASGSMRHRLATRAQAVRARIPATMQA
jgi:hypothetical protein